MSFRICVVVTLAFAVESCHPPVPPETPSLAQGLAGLQRSFNEAGALSLSDITDSVMFQDSARVSDSGRKAIERQFQVAQCIAQTGNPFMPVITGSFSLALAAQESRTGTVGETVTKSATPSLALPFSYAVQDQTGRTVTVPLVFVPLKVLPDYYFGLWFTNVTGIANATVKDSFAKNLLARRDTLAAWVNYVIGHPAIDTDAKFVGDTLTCGRLLHALRSKNGKVPLASTPISAPK